MTKHEYIISSSENFSQGSSTAKLFDTRESILKKKARFRCLLGFGHLIKVVSPQIGTLKQIQHKCCLNGEKHVPIKI